MSAPERSVCAEAPSEAPSAPVEAPSATPSPLREHSNDNLIKVDTFDTYSTIAAIKKFIGKALGDKIDPNAQPMFKGMKRMNKNPRAPYLFMAFETQEDQEAALALLQQVSFRGRTWRSVPVTARDLALTHKGPSKRPREGGDEEVSKLTQYEKYTMKEQLDMKTKHCLRVMKLIVQSRQYGWDAYAKRFLGIVESPQQEGYRNHVNLSFGRTVAGVPSLGFQTGSLVEGQSTIESAVDKDKNILTMHAAAKVVAMAVMEVYERFAADGLGVFDKISGTGFWRKLQIRHNIHGEVMVDIELDEDSIDADLFTRVKQALVEALTSTGLVAKLKAAAKLDTAKVVSVQYHKHTGVHSLPMDAARTVLYGASTLTETLSGLAYELSPTAFFQVNTPGMERMLERVQSVAELTPQTTLLDLCSGTGTIGLTLARHVKRVIGIELVESAVENAKRNAERNNITNAQFHCGRVENLLPTVIAGLSPADRENIVAILDPPRAGVNGTVLKWIRGTPTIKRVVYISCEQKALERDCPGLTKPATKAYRGDPFEVAAGFAVDLFPHTHHVEMVVVLTRVEGGADPEPAEAVEDAAPASEPSQASAASGSTESEDCE